MKKFIILVVLSFLILFTSCQSTKVIDISEDDLILNKYIEVGYNSGYIERFVDSEAQVVCWTYRAYRGNGSQGRFKNFARVFDKGQDPDTKAALRIEYFVGQANVNNVVLNANSSLILNQWNIIDLTDNEMMNLDIKNLPDIPSQMGYTVLSKRESGAAGIKIDYILTLPTDGGYILADILPSLKYGMFFIIDNAKSNKLNVMGVINTTNAHYTIFDTNDGGQGGIIEYNGDVYIGTVGGGTSSRGSVIKYTQGSWSKQSLDAVTGNTLLWPEIYNGEIYFLRNYIFGVSDAVLVKSSDGDSWSVAASFPADDITCNTSLPFNGYLWVNVYSTTANEGRTYKWNGTTLSLSKTYVGGERPQQMTVYKNLLYTVTDTGSIFSYNPATDIWTEELNTAFVFSGMQEYKGKIYISASNNNVYSWDGITLTLENTFPTHLGSMTIYNDKLYVTNPFNPALYSIASFDGETWSEVFSHTENKYNYGKGSSVGLFITFNVGGGNAKITYYSDDSLTFTIPTYEGGGFSAPNRTLQSDSRHRYFFSYDREGFINNIDDKALIGIGYRPRYFSLINKDDF